MTEKTALWDKLGRTDPAHTKQFKRAGGFQGTAIKPMWSYRRMTEEFGPCGTGWGINQPSFQVVAGCNNEVLVYCTVSIWYAKANPAYDATDSVAHCLTQSNTVFGVGGDKIVTHIKENKQYNRPERWENDDEAFKKAYTDAVTNALKMIGVGADVHMGMFDDNKYVNTLQREFAEKPEPEPAPAPPAKAKRVVGFRSDGTRTSNALRKTTSWGDLDKMLQEDMLDVHSMVAFEKLKAEYRVIVGEKLWPKEWVKTLADRFDYYENQIKAANSNDVVEDIANTFPGAKIVNEHIHQHPLMAGE